MSFAHGGAYTNYLEDQLKSIINNLYLLIAQTYEYHGANTAQAMTAEMYSSHRYFFSNSRPLTLIQQASCPESPGPSQDITTSSNRPSSGSH